MANDMDFFDSIIADKKAKHKDADSAYKEDNTRAVAQVTMTSSQKLRLTTIARMHGLSLSAFFRLASDEYIQNHGWE